MLYRVLSVFDRVFSMFVLCCYWFIMFYHGIRVLLEIRVYCVYYVLCCVIVFLLCCIVVIMFFSAYRG
jgi:hypothetical protein